MSHIANDIVADSKLDTLNERKLEVECTCDDTDAYFELQLEEKERDEWQYDNSYEPTCNHTH